MFLEEHLNVYGGASECCGKQTLKIGSSLQSAWPVVERGANLRLNCFCFIRYTTNMSTGTVNNG